MGNHKQQSKSYENVIPLVLNASLYYNKAIDAAERNNYTKALRFFTRAVEIEPDNPVNHCNVAGILSEMGRFEESNHILRYILDNIAPNLHECYFYLANNYAYLNQFEEAERNAVRYLHYAPDGVYAEDTEELLEHLSYELGRSTHIEEDHHQFAKGEFNDRARRLLEQGKFSEATKVLKETIAKYPDFLPARNNLALTYYYSGKMDEAISEAYRVLDQEENNLHALCNLAIFFKEMGEVQRLKDILSGLTKLYPMHSENVYKLATTLGILGEHEACYRLFLTLYKDHGMNTPSLIHQIAVAAYNIDDINEAERWWRKLGSFEGAEEIGHYFLEQLQKGSLGPQPLSYRYPAQPVPPTDSPDAEHKLLSIIRGIMMLLRRNWRDEYVHFLPEAESRLSSLTQIPVSRLEKVRKLEALAAAVEYTVLSEIVRVSKKEIAERYAISLSTLNRYLEEYPCSRG